MLSFFVSVCLWIPVQLIYFGMTAVKRQCKFAQILSVGCYPREAVASFAGRTLKRRNGKRECHIRTLKNCFSIYYASGRILSHDRGRMSVSNVYASVVSEGVTPLADDGKRARTAFMAFSFFFVSRKRKLQRSCCMSYHFGFYMPTINTGVWGYIIFTYRRSFPCEFELNIHIAIVICSIKTGRGILCC